jgi:hypothetical protein
VVWERTLSQPLLQLLAAVLLGRELHQRLLLLRLLAAGHSLRLAPKDMANEAALIIAAATVSTTAAAASIATTIATTVVSAAAVSTVPKTSSISLRALLATKFSALIVVRIARHAGGAKLER